MKEKEKIEHFSSEKEQLSIAVFIFYSHTAYISRIHSVIVNWIDPVSELQIDALPLVICCMTRCRFITIIVKLRRVRLLINRS